MNYWWVNQKQTFAVEFPGGFLWSPQRKSNGDRNPFYETMRQVEPGDTILSYVGARFAAIGFALTGAYDCPRPKDFNDKESNWSNHGWRVDVEYHPIDSIVRPKDFFAELKPLLPTKYSPLSNVGGGLQSVYLASLPIQAAKLILSKIWNTNEDIPKPPPIYNGAKDPLADLAEERIRGDQKISKTERTALIAARMGQGLFRERILKIEPRCRVTGVTNSTFLIASHIWPWRYASNQDRLDPNNGLSLAPHIDILFDKGYITFSDDGTVIVSSQADPDVLEKFGVKQGISVGPFNNQQKAFLRMHREGLPTEGLDSIFRR